MPKPHFRMPSLRVARNFLAQIYGQASTILIQLGTIPVLLSAWGTSRYGVWLVLTSIASYLMFCDFGFTSISKNDMSIRVAGEDRDGALETYQSAFVAISMLIVLVALLSCLVLWVIPLGKLVHIGPLDTGEARVVVACQILTVLLYQLFLLFCAGFRAEGRAATEALLTSNSRLLEAGLLVGAALSGAGLGAAAIVILVARALQIFAVAAYLHRTAPWLQLGRKRASWSRTRSLLLPSLTYMLSPVANAILIQGPLVLLGASIAPQQVAAFSVTRTFTRLGTSGANLLNMTLGPEYSYAYGRDDIRAFGSTLRIHVALTGIGVVMFLLTVRFFGPFGVHLLSHDHILPDPRLLWILAIATAFEIAWSTAFAAIAALNAHKTSATFAALIAAVVLALAPRPSEPLGVAMAIALANALILVCCFAMLLVTARRIANLGTPARLNMTEISA